MIRFSFAVGNANLEIEAEDAKDLVGQFELVGGDGSQLIKEVKAAAADPFELKVLLSDQATPLHSESTSATAEAVDPWADDAPTSQTAHPSNPDPWADDDSTTVATTPAPSNTGISKSRDDFGRVWTMGLPEAPNCDCGIKAARMDAKAKGSGKPYSKWNCSLAAGKQWKDKCEYSEFVSKK